MWTPKTLTLAWPLTRGTEQLSVLTFNPITRAEHVEALKADGGKERAVLEKLATLSCGLSAAEFKLLKYPDHNSVKQILSDYVSKSTAWYYAQVGETFNPDKHDLLVPITGDNGKAITAIELKVPTVQVIDIMETLDEADRNDYLTQDVTGLSQTEIDRLSTQDWNQQQERIGDFLGQTAEYFQAVM